MKRNISILGSTGSIGKQTLEVAKHLSINVCALAAKGSDPDLIVNQAMRFSPKLVAVSSDENFDYIKDHLKSTSIKVECGPDAINEAASIDEADCIVSSIMGNSGIAPNFAAIDAKKDIALANKETIVSSGELFLEKAANSGITVTPVDSEHSAIFQSLRGRDNNKVRSIILTASGGPFRGRTRSELASVTAMDALKHPTWSMGAKITIDSATLMNKGLEVIEAKFLFDVDPKDIKVVVHPQSILHSAVEFEDGSVIGQMGNPDMRLPIQYALTFPDRVASLEKPLDLASISSLSFFEPDTDTFECLKLAYMALEKGSTTMCALNGANEESVMAFLDGKIGFLDIYKVNLKVINEHSPIVGYSLDDLYKTDLWARQSAKDIIKEIENE